MVLPVDPASVLGGGLETSATSGAQGGYLDFIYNGAFNVGSGELRSDANSSSGGFDFNSIFGIALPALVIGGVVLLVMKVAK